MYTLSTSGLQTTGSNNGSFTKRNGNSSTSILSYQVGSCRTFYVIEEKEKKLVILIITRAIVIAVRLELIDSLTSEDCLLGLRRFDTRRGLPSVVYSDNCKTFQAASKTALDQMRTDTIKWKFNAPLSPWWGGCWECLVRSTKSGLIKSLGRRLV